MLRNLRASQLSQLCNLVGQKPIKLPGSHYHTSILVNQEFAVHSPDASRSSTVLWDMKNMMRLMIKTSKP